MKVNLLSESVFLRANSSFPGVCTRLLWMLAIQALIVVPLFVGGEVAGTLNVGRMGRREAHFSDGEFELARLCASVVMLAVPSPAERTIGP